MPDKNAAAQRVLSVAKAFRALGYEVSFYGITKSGDFIGDVDGFYYEAQKYPQSTLSWIRYALGLGVVRYIKKLKPSHIVLYNYPAFAQNKIIHYGHQHGITVIGDITEWYESRSLVKKLDTFFRMRWCNKRLDGIIAISKYLADYYSKQQTLLLPPLVDKSETKWKKIDFAENEDKIELIYAGSPGNKDRLDFIIKGICDVKENKFILRIIGITKEQFERVYKDFDKEKIANVQFCGRLSHQEVVRMLNRTDFQVFFRENTRVNNAGFPTKLVESMSAGIPVITNRTSNISDYIIDGQNGFIINDLTLQSVIDIFTKVSLLKKEDIVRMKRNCDNAIFDYHNYIESVWDFINRIGRA